MLIQYFSQPFHTYPNLNSEELINQNLNDIQNKINLNCAFIRNIHILEYPLSERINNIIMYNYLH